MHQFNDPHRKIDHKLAETTWVHKLFGGRLRSRVTCMQCGYNSDTFDSILDLSIDIHGCASLKDALRKFTAVDYLKGADKYKCEKCVMFLYMTLAWPPTNLIYQMQTTGQRGEALHDPRRTACFDCSSQTFLAVGTEARASHQV